MCPHDRKIGDNYGLSCADCGAQLEGYGCWGEGDGTCHHRFPSDSLEGEKCAYCLQALVPVDKEWLV
jgi:hypothetical protein